MNEIINFKTYTCRNIIPLKEIVKEVDVEASLYYSAHIHDKVVLVVGFVVRTVNPIQDVQETISSQEKHVLAGQVLDLAVPL